MIALVFLFVCGLAWCAGGFVTLAGSKTVMHEIMAVLLFSFGVLFLGVAQIVALLGDANEAAEKAYQREAGAK